MDASLRLWQFHWIIRFMKANRQIRIGTMYT